MIHNIVLPSLSMVLKPSPPVSLALSSNIRSNISSRLVSVTITTVTTTSLTTTSTCAISAVWLMQTHIVLVIAQYSLTTPLNYCGKPLMFQGYSACFTSGLFFQNDRKPGASYSRDISDVLPSYQPHKGQVYRHIFTPMRQTTRSVHPQLQSMTP